MAEELLGSMSESSGESLGEASSEAVSSSSQGSSESSGGSGGERPPKGHPPQQQLFSAEDLRHIPPR